MNWRGVRIDWIPQRLSLRHFNSHDSVSCTGGLVYWEFLLSEVSNNRNFPFPCDFYSIIFSWGALWRLNLHFPSSIPVIWLLFVTPFCKCTNYLIYISQYFAIHKSNGKWNKIKFEKIGLNCLLCTTFSPPTEEIIRLKPDISPFYETSLK